MRKDKEFASVYILSFINNVKRISESFVLFNLSIPSTTKDKTTGAYGKPARLNACAFGEIGDLVERYQNKKVEIEGSLRAHHRDGEQYPGVQVVVTCIYEPGLQRDPDHNDPKDKEAVENLKVKAAAMEKETSEKVKARAAAIEKVRVAKEILGAEEVGPDCPF